MAIIRRERRGGLLVLGGKENSLVLLLNDFGGTLVVLRVETKRVFVFFGNDNRLVQIGMLVLLLIDGDVMADNAKNIALPQPFAVVHALHELLEKI